MQQQQLIDAETAAPLLGLTNKIAVYSAVRAGLVPAVRIGRRVRFDVETLKTWIQNGGTATGAKAPQAKTASA